MPSKEDIERYNLCLGHGSSEGEAIGLEFIPATRLLTPSVAVVAYTHTTVAIPDPKEVDGPTNLGVVVLNLEQAKRLRDLVSAFLEENENE